MPFGTALSLRKPSRLSCARRFRLRSRSYSQTPKLPGDPLASHLWFDQSYYLPDDILDEGRSNEHGAFHRSAPAVSRSPYR